MADDFDDRRRPRVLTQDEREVYTPARLNREARQLLERGFPTLWIEGELSNLSRPASGPWYFSLKDDAAQLRCAMFRQKNLLTTFAPRDGLHVLARGRISLYEPRGDFQLIVEHLEEAGEGQLRREFERLKARLAAEGLFAQARKRLPPEVPRRIGIVTSPTGAAIRDILHVLARRFPAVPVLVYPVPVQGQGAALKIADAIRRADERQDCDVLIVARGGGSLEDLWPFNEEVVARAIYDCGIAVVSGVGHEIDFTIADFVAEVRAPTPSAAAELVVPDCQEWNRTVAACERRLAAAWRRRLAAGRQSLNWTARRLEQLHPGFRLRQQAQQLDDLEMRLASAIGRRLARQRSTLAEHSARLARCSPAARLASLRGREAKLALRLE
ncbi:MAG TPA: exodeoxyribonuclease VII large subunit, partial [Steroidobacteraceae bacterium]|nr:exodeoxyribonuclease VII large subunit [Steroidobacteraceae bacterium]